LSTLGFDTRVSETEIMLFKIIALIMAAVPLILFLRSIFFRRPTRLGARMKELKKDFDFAVSAFLVLVGCVVVFALGNLVWAWWRSF
jgi:hypothetical protein